MSNRRRYYSLPVPLKYASILSLIVGFLILIMIFVMAWFIQRNYNLFLADELGVSSQVIELVRREQQLLETTLFLLFVGSLSVIFGFSLYVTRKLTGPIVALQRHLILLLRGETNREFKLQKNDEFKDLEPLINELKGKINASQHP